MEIVPARAILVAAKLGVADHINAEGVTATQLAAKLNADAVAPPATSACQYRHFA
jgi:hypothetical protein